MVKFDDYLWGIVAKKVVYKHTNANNQYNLLGEG